MGKSEKDTTHDQDYDATAFEFDSLDALSGEALREEYETLQDATEDRTKSGRKSKKAREAESELETRKLIEGILAPLADIGNAALSRIHPEMAIADDQMTVAVVAYTRLLSKYAPEKIKKFGVEFTALAVTGGIATEKVMTYKRLVRAGEIEPKKKSRKNGTKTKEPKEKQNE